MKQLLLLTIAAAACAAGASSAEETDLVDCIDPMTNTCPEDISRINTPSGSYAVNNITRDASCIKFECDNNIIILQNIDNDNIIVYADGSDDPEIYALSQVDFE